MLKVLTVPNIILTSPNKPIINFDRKLIKFVNEMNKTLVAQSDPQGVGLAAPQVGYNLQLFIIKPTPESKIEVFINPKIIKKVRRSTLKNQTSKKLKTPLEGCLSIPRIWGSVKRANKLLIEYQTSSGEKKQVWFTGFKAVIIQHEFDHLNGLLFTEQAVKQKSPLYEEKNGKLERMM